MICDRLVLGAVLVVLGGVAAAQAPVIAASGGVPPFCVKRGGSMGPDSRPQLCRWYDYQSCLQAAADLNGNCVVNIDYKGVVSLEPVGPRERRSR